MFLSFFLLRGSNFISAFLVLRWEWGTFLCRAQLANLKLGCASRCLPVTQAHLLKTRSRVTLLCSILMAHGHLEAVFSCI